MQDELGAAVADGLLQVEALERDAAAFQQHMGADACEARAAAMQQEAARLRALLDARKQEVVYNH